MKRKRFVFSLVAGLVAQAQTTPLFTHSTFGLLTLPVNGVTPAGKAPERPEARWTHHLTYDEATEQVLLFGGAHGNKILGDLWSWNGQAWKPLATSGPPARNKGVFVYDASRKRTVLFGGVNQADNNVDDTWEWDGVTWKQLVGKGPVARAHALGAYDAKNKMVVLFGGFGPSGVLSDTWGFDGSAWKKLDNNGPANCLPHGMVYDEARKAVVLITVALNSEASKAPPKNEMWEWTGNAWRKLPFATPAFPQLQAVASFQNNRIVLYDGSDTTQQSGKTWLFNSTEWTPLAGLGPGLRQGHAMAYDKTRKRIVLFGGGIGPDRYNDTWEWDGLDWKKKK